MNVASSLDRLARIALTALLTGCIHCALAQTALEPQSMKALADVNPRHGFYSSVRWIFSAIPFI